MDDSCPVAFITADGPGILCMDDGVNIWHMVVLIMGFIGQIVVLRVKFGCCVVSRFGSGGTSRM